MTRRLLQWPIEIPTRLEIGLRVRDHLMDAWAFLTAWLQYGWRVRPNARIETKPFTAPPGLIRLKSRARYPRRVFARTPWFARAAQRPFELALAESRRWSFDP